MTTTIELMRKYVAEQLPIKQGLKPESVCSSRGSIAVAEQLPIKQGLKRIGYRVHIQTSRCRRATSNKTRIETLDNTLAAAVWTESQSNFQ